MKPTQKEIEIQYLNQISFIELGMRLKDDIWVKKEMEVLLNMIRKKK